LVLWSRLTLFSVGTSLFVCLFARFPVLSVYLFATINT